MNILASVMAAMIRQFSVAYNQSLLTKFSSEAMVVQEEWILIAIFCTLPAIFLAFVVSSICCKQSRNVLNVFASSSPESGEEGNLLPNETSNESVTRNEETREVH